MSEAVDFSKPICVQHFTAQITSATYDRHQTLHPERYEIFWQGKRWTVRGDNVVQGQPMRWGRSRRTTSCGTSTERLLALFGPIDPLTWAIAYTKKLAAD